MKLYRVNMMFAYLIVVQQNRGRERRERARRASTRLLLAKMSSLCANIFPKVHNSTNGVLPDFQYIALRGNTAEASRASARNTWVSISQLAS